MGKNGDEQSAKFREIVEKIRSIFSLYSIDDIASALFVSNLWLPNIASPAQHQFLYAILLSIKTEEFQKKAKITSYADFRSLMEKIYPLVPSFHMIEDYIPHPDWGEIKFHHNEENYKIFYGNEFENIYDNMMTFQMMYSSLDEKYIESSGKSPDNDLTQALIIQDMLINNLNPGIKKSDLKRITQGHTEVPSEDFWLEASAFYSGLNPDRVVQKSFLDEYSTTPGNHDATKFDVDYVYGHLFSGALIEKFFIKNGDKYLLFLPRRILSVVLDNWHKEFKKHKKAIDGDKSYYTLHLNSEVYHYLKVRIRESGIFPIASALDKDDKPMDVMFSVAFISHGRLILIYIAPPFSTASEINVSLKEIEPKLIEAEKSMKERPRLGLNLDRKVVEFRSDRKKKLEPYILVVLPQATTQPAKITIPKKMPGRILFLDELLAIFDEIKNTEEVSEFIDYLEENDATTSVPMIGLVDKFGSFRGSSGVLIPGAVEPTMIMLDPHWGGDMRFDSLSEFWKLYPDKNFYHHPRAWRIEKETETRIRLESRSRRASCIYLKIKNTGIFSTSPFEFLVYEEAAVTNLLMESLEDAMSRYIKVISKHCFFTSYEQLQINIFPVSLSEKEHFGHLKSQDPGEDFWNLEKGYLKPSFPAIRIVINDKKLMEALNKVQDSTIEMDFAIAVLEKINEFMPDTQIDEIKNELEKHKSGKPRYKAFYGRKDVAFPEFENPFKPTMHDHKKARKRIAELALTVGLKPGKYKVADAEEKLNELRKKVVEEVNAEVSKYSFEEVLPIAIAKVDALNHEYWRKKESVELSQEHQVDYVREESYAKEHSDYLLHHKNYRYFIEKLVQLIPKGKEEFGIDDFKYIIALIDKLHEIYSASDSIHYEIYPVGLEVTRDFLILVNYRVDLDKMQKEFGEEQARIDLGLIGKESDRADSAQPIEHFLDKIDEAFKKDFGFALRTLGGTLTILSSWPGYFPKAKESASYAASEQEIKDTCLKNITPVEESEIKPLLEFLTLKTKDVIRVLGKDDDCEDIPVWEHQKRYSRYDIRPLIKIGDLFHWGAHSAKRAGIIWSGVISKVDLPSDVGGSEIKKVLRNEHANIEKGLELKALEIFKEILPNAEPNVYLHKRDKGAGYLEGLGDYDVLAYDEKNNIAFNVEAKEIDQTFCLKDSGRMKKQIFGKENKKGYLEKVENRAEYLKKNFSKVAKTMKWQVTAKTPPKIVSLFISRRMYWWTKFPIRSTDVVFLRIDLLREFLSNK